MITNLNLYLIGGKLLKFNLIWTGSTGNLSFFIHLRSKTSAMLFFGHSIINFF